MNENFLHFEPVNINSQPWATYFFPNFFDLSIKSSITKFYRITIKNNGIEVIWSGKVLFCLTEKDI